MTTNRDGIEGQFTTAATTLRCLSDAIDEATRGVIERLGHHSADSLFLRFERRVECEMERGGDGGMRSEE